MLWIKALHLISVISWFAGLLYLPRLFVYHVNCHDKTGRERFMTMEHRLYRYIMQPAMLFSLIFGVTLMRYGYSGNWLHYKLVIVLLLLAFHVRCGQYIKKFRANQTVPSATFFRYYNEIPTVFLIIIVCLAVVKPF